MQNTSILLGLYRILDHSAGLGVDFILFLCMTTGLQEQKQGQGLAQNQGLWVSRRGAVAGYGVEFDRSFTAVRMFFLWRHWAQDTSAIWCLNEQKWALFLANLVWDGGASPVKLHVRLICWYYGAIWWPRKECSLLVGITGVLTCCW